MIEIIGAPFDLGGKRLGSRLGPSAIRLANLRQTLQSMGLGVVDLGDVEVDVEGEPREDCGPAFAHFPSLLKCADQLRHTVAQVLARGGLPLILGGEHTLSVGGIAAALNTLPGGLGLIWIDAHADVHTPGSSTSGRIHGMPLGALLGLPETTPGPGRDEWKLLLEHLGPNRLELSNLGWYGLRDVDHGERERVRAGFAITMHEIDRFGIEATVRRMAEFLKATGVSNLWISFDVDALDPILAPGTGTAVRGGLTYRESHLFAELVRELLDEPSCPYRLVGVDVVEVNPLIDANNETAVMAVEWVASLLGKTILGL